jgi:hypothetical protein
MDDATHYWLVGAVRIDSNQNWWDASTPQIRFPEKNIENWGILFCMPDDGAILASYFFDEKR